MARRLSAGRQAQLQRIVCGRANRQKVLRSHVRWHAVARNAAAEQAAGSWGTHTCEPRQLSCASAEGSQHSPGSAAVPIWSMVKVPSDCSVHLQAGRREEGGWRFEHHSTACWRQGRQRVAAPSLRTGQRGWASRQGTKQEAASSKQRAVGKLAAGTERHASRGRLRARLAGTD